MVLFGCCGKLKGDGKYKKLGFKKAYNLKGGVIELEKIAYPLIK